MPDQFASLAATLKDRYVVERELGRGGMATVYLAHDVRHDRPVALKVLQPELAAMVGTDRFLAEIRTTANLQHPHILALFDSGVVGGAPYYVMPFVDGESLRQRLEREGALPVEDAVRLTVDIASALEYAHRRAIVHRDIKPENILLHEGEAMLADFGIALGLAGSNERLTGTGLAIGTPDYMSPEQAVGERALDPRSDIYSLACVLYEMLVGDPPFAAPTAQAAIAMRLVGGPPSPRQFRPALPATVEQAIMRALSPERGERFDTARAFADALTQPVSPQEASPSVAVLPFLNLSPDPDNEYFADGVTEDVIAHLTKVRGLKVISRSSVMPFRKREQGLRDIARRLGVASLLDGSVRRAGERVRIVAQLIDAETERPVWGETYDRQLTDIFAIQTDVALRIAAALRAELSLDEQARIRVEPTRDMRAYQSYLLGREHYRRYTDTSMRRGIAYFEQAVEQDPEYALAYAAQALAWVEIAQQGGPVRPDEAYAQARRLATRALDIDPRAGDAHAVMAMLKFMYDFDWAGSEAEFKLALELSPGSADIYDHYGWLCSALCRHDEAVALSKKARDLDPIAHFADVASALLRAGRDDEALQECLMLVVRQPDYPRAHATLGWAWLRTGHRDEGLRALEHAVALGEDTSTWRAQLGQAYGMEGRPDDARQILRELEALARERYVSPYHLAYVHTGLGDQDAAIDWLERAFEERAAGVYNIKGSFLFTPLHGHPRFTALLQKMRLA